MKKEKLYDIDRIRLEEIFLILEHVRGGYIDEIEDAIDKIEDATSNALNKQQGEVVLQSDYQQTIDALKAENARLREGVFHAIELLSDIQPRRILMESHKKTLTATEKYLILLARNKALESESE